METKNTKKELDFDKCERILLRITQWYLNEILRAANKYGIERLSISLGHTEKYLYKVLQRRSLTGLRTIVKRIKIYEMKKSGNRTPGREFSRRIEENN